MKNNKGFAITATIYGFLVLFLIILLCVLATMRSENNRSLIISDKIDKRTFLYNETKLDPSETLTFPVTNLSRGKYYITLVKSSGTYDNCYFYLPSNSTLKLEGNILKITRDGTDTNAKIYGTNCNNSGITEIKLVKHYNANTN